MQIELNALELLLIKSALDNKEDTAYRSPQISSTFRELQQKVNSAINIYPGPYDVTPVPIFHSLEQALLYKKFNNPEVNG